MRYTYNVYEKLKKIYKKFAFTFVIYDFTDFITNLYYVEAASISGKKDIQYIIRVYRGNVHICGRRKDLFTVLKWYQEDYRFKLYFFRFLPSLLTFFSRI